MMLGFWLVIAALAYFVIKSNKSTPGKDRQEKAIALVKERFARGEIDESEYRSKLDILQEDE